MELLPPVGWGDVARQSDLTALRGEMAMLRADLSGRIDKLGGRIDKLDARFDTLFAKVVVTQVLTSAALGGFLVSTSRFV